MSNKVIDVCYACNKEIFSTSANECREFYYCSNYLCYECSRESECISCENPICGDCAFVCHSYSRLKLMGYQPVCDCKDSLYCPECLTSVECCDGSVCQTAFLGWCESDWRKICLSPGCYETCTTCKFGICAEDCTYYCEICEKGYCASSFTDSSKICGARCDTCEKSFCDHCINSDKHRCDRE